MPNQIIFLEDAVLVYTGFMEPLEQVNEVGKGKSLSREYSCSSAFAAGLLLTLRGLCPSSHAPASSARLFKQLRYVKQGPALRDEFSSLSLEQPLCFPVTLDPLRRDSLDRDHSLLATQGASASSSSVQCQGPWTNGNPSCQFYVAACSPAQPASSCLEAALPAQQPRLPSDPGLHWYSWLASTCPALVTWHHFSSAWKDGPWLFCH